MLTFRNPVRGVTDVTLCRFDGAPKALIVPDYFLDRELRPLRLHLNTPPQCGQALNSVKIDFSACFGESGLDVPNLLPKRAILMPTAH